MSDEDQMVETPETEDVKESVQTDQPETNSQPVDNSESQDSQEQPATELDIQEFVDKLEVDDAQKKILKDSFMRQQDYTRKTQELAEQRRLYNQYEPILTKLIQQPELLNLVNGYGQQPQPEPEEQEFPTDPREFAEYVKQQTIQEMMNRQAVTQDLERASNLDPRLNSDNPADVNFQRVVLGLVAQDTDAVAGRKSMEQAVREAVEWFDNDFYKGVQSGYKNSVEQQVQNKRYVTPKSSSPAKTEQQIGPSIYDAYKAALDEVGG